MSGFLFALIACFLASLGARDQVLVARLSATLGPRLSLVVIALVCAGVTSVLAAWAGSRLLPELTPQLRTLTALLMLVLSGAEMLLIGPGKAPMEPTRSLFAAAIVLAAQQITDGARLLVLALAVGTAAPIPAGLGGAIGSATALLAGALAADWPARLGRVRRIAGAALALIGLALLARLIIA